MFGVFSLTDWVNESRNPHAAMVKFQSRFGSSHELSGAQKKINPRACSNSQELKQPA